MQTPFPIHLHKQATANRDAAYVYAENAMYNQDPDKKNKLINITIIQMRGKKREIPHISACEIQI